MDKYWVEVDGMILETRQVKEWQPFYEDFDAGLHIRVASCPACSMMEPSEVCIRNYSASVIGHTPECPIKKIVEEAGL